VGRLLTRARALFPATAEELKDQLATMFLVFWATMFFGTAALRIVAGL
jgi:hypothetical protein